jgi:hypothetical protein
MEERGSLITRPSRVSPRSTFGRAPGKADFEKSRVSSDIRGAHDIVGEGPGRHLRERPPPSSCSPVALPRILDEIEADLTEVKVSTAEKWRLRQRAGLVRRLLSLAEPRVNPSQATDYPIRP